MRGGRTLPAMAEAGMSKTSVVTIIRLNSLFACNTSRPAVSLKQLSDFDILARCPIFFGAQADVRADDESRIKCNAQSATGTNEGLSDGVAEVRPPTCDHTCVRKGQHGQVDGKASDLRLDEGPADFLLDERSRPTQSSGVRGCDNRRSMSHGSRTAQAHQDWPAHEGARRRNILPRPFM